jgi:predicted GNAT superfamily acetyltransferase
MPESVKARETKITVRHCHGLAECVACFELQRRVWGESDVAVPTPIFVIAGETGGQLLGAFAGDASRQENLVGFTLAIAGWRDSQPLLHSHMTAVLEEMRDRGVGRKLKLFQRDDALARGIELVEWTFDPLEVKNGYFNLMRLGATARRYLSDFYGITSSALHGGLPTDRLVAEWWLRSEEVRRVVAGQEKPPRAKAAEQRRILIPAEWQRLKREDRDAALRTQGEIRQQFQEWFSRGYAATRMERSAEGACYVLEPWHD